MTARAAATMIRRCHAHQWPTEYGRALIPEPTSEELAFKTPTRFEPLPVTPCFTTWCQRCGCDHGPAPIATDYGGVAG